MQHQPSRLSMLYQQKDETLDVQCLVDSQPVATVVESLLLGSRALEVRSRSMSTRVIIIPADDAQAIRVHEAEKQPGLQELQDIVDGYIPRRAPLGRAGGYAMRRSTATRKASCATCRSTSAPPPCG